MYLNANAFTFARLLTQLAHRAHFVRAQKVAHIVDDNGPRKNVSHNVEYVIKFTTRNSDDWRNVLER